MSVPDLSHQTQPPMESFLQSPIHEGPYSKASKSLQNARYYAKHPEKTAFPLEAGSSVQSDILSFSSAAVTRKDRRQNKPSIRATEKDTMSPKNSPSTSYHIRSSSPDLDFFGQPDEHSINGNYARRKIIKSTFVLWTSSLILNVC